MVLTPSEYDRIIELLSIALNSAEKRLEVLDKAHQDLKAYNAQLEAENNQLVTKLRDYQLKEHIAQMEDA